jgi:hypothetical protein
MCRAADRKVKSKEQVMQDPIIEASSCGESGRPEEPNSTTTTVVESVKTLAPTTKFDGGSKDIAREEIRKRLRTACETRSASVAFSELPETWKQDRLVAFEAIGLDPTGRVLEIIPELDNEASPLKQHRELVMIAVQKSGTNLKFIGSDLLKNDREIALAAVTQSTRACKYIGEELKRDKVFVTDMLRKFIGLEREENCCSSVIDAKQEPKRVKVNRYAFAFPVSWPDNASPARSNAEFGHGEFELPLGIDSDETTETNEVEIITSNPYAGQSKVFQGIDETILHDPEVLCLLFELDPVALLLNDIHRKEACCSGVQNNRTSKPLKPISKTLVGEWYQNHERNQCELKRLQCWPTTFWEQEDDVQVAIGDNIHFWIEAARRTNTRSLLAEAPKDILTDEEKMLEALTKDIELFRVIPWQLRVSETLNAKLQSAFPDSFLWITLGDPRAQIPSKARNSETSEMVAAFYAVQKRTGLQRHEVPFLQLNLLS